MSVPKEILTCGVVHHNLALFKAPAGARPTYALQLENLKLINERVIPQLK